MICDTQEQKNFLLECVRKYPTTYETALNLANAFGQAIQDARVVSVNEQLEKIPVPGQPDQPTNEATKDVKLEDLKKVQGNGDDQTARVQGGPTPNDPSGKAEQDLTKGPAK